MEQVETHIQPQYAGLLNRLGFNAAWVFDNARVVPWRTLADRENCIADIAGAEGGPVRLHIKRYPPRWAATARDEARGLQLLEKFDIPCASMIAWGAAPDGRGFVITEDLRGFTAADKAIPAGQPFESLLSSTAQLAARLHAAGLHHRDLYPCHFFVRVDASGVDVRLIDAARVRRLPRWPMRQRWIVKDLAQFWYGAMQLNIPVELRRQWLDEYWQSARSGQPPAPILADIEKKVRAMAAHDKKLNQRQPTRHVSLNEREAGK